MDKPLIFLNYRKDDTAPVAGRLYDRLANEYGDEQVFRDVYSIPAGSNYRETIETRLSRCNIFIILIGEIWLTDSEAGVRRLDAPEDLLRREIEAALQHGLPILPLLVEQAEMPAKEQLPPSIASIQEIQAWPITDRLWRQDVAAVLEWIKRAPEVTRPPRPKLVSTGPSSDHLEVVRPTPEWPSTPTHSFEYPLRKDHLKTRGALGLSGRVNSAAFSPDGLWLAAAGSDNTARIWDLATRTEAHALLLPLGEGLTSVEMTTVAFGPDSAWLVTGSTDGTVQLWDVIEGDELGQVTNERGVSALSVSPDGRWLATGDKNGIVQLWRSAGRAKPIRETQLTHDGEVTAVAYSPDSHLLATGSKDGRARIWGPELGDDRPRTIDREEIWEVTAVAFSPDGHLLATGTRDGAAEGTLRIWNAHTKRHLKTLEEKDWGWVTTVAFSPVNGWLATGSIDGSARIWDASTYELLAVLPSKDPRKDVVRMLAFSPDGLLLGVCVSDRVDLWALGRSARPTEGTT